MEKMNVFLHQLYEYKKGVRPIALCTLPKNYKKPVCDKLDKEGVAYIIRELSDGKFNLFFGNSLCMDVLAMFGNKPLNELTAEEDFILGTMLGYSVSEQCRRYCKKMQKQAS